MPTRRDMLKAGTALAFSSVAHAIPEESKVDDTFRAQRLSWAGVKLQYRDTTLFIDPLMDASIWDGAWKLPIAPIEFTTPRKYVLLTHLHNDHFDPMAIKAIAKDSGVTVVCHESRAAVLGSRGFRAWSAALYEPVTVGDLTATAVPAVDGFNEYQVSWVISNGTKRVIHCGDTLWHGAFWQIGQQHGPIEAAFLPINGAKFPEKNPYSDVEATMTPAHAVAAAVVMRAKVVVPIHYGLNDPKSYLEHPNCVAEVKSIGAKRNQPVHVLEPGEWISI